MVLLKEGICVHVGVVMGLMKVFLNFGQHLVCNCLVKIVMIGRN